MRRPVALALAYAVAGLAWLAARDLVPGGESSPALRIAIDAAFLALSALGFWFALRAADRARSAAESKFRLATDMPGAFYWEIDADLRFTRLEGGIVEYFGLDPKEAVGKQSKELYNTRIVSMTSEAFAQIRAERKPYRDVRASLRLREGELRYVCIDGDPVFDAEGRFRGYRGITRDITAQVEAEQALQASEQRFRRIVETVPQLLFFITNPGRDRWIYRSPNWAQIWNYHAPVPSTGQVKPVRERILPEDLARFNNRAEAEARGEVVDIEFRYMDPERGLRWLRTRTVGIPQPDGEVEVYGVTEDVTDRRHALEQISASDALHRSVLAGMAEGLLVRNREGVITSANAAAGRILGQDLSRLIGGGTIHAYGAAQREDGSRFDKADYPWNVVMTTGRAVLGTVMGWRREDRSIVWLRINAVPLGPADAPEGVVATFQDITAERASQAELALLAATLERRVAQRTDALTKTNRQLEAFAHSVSHDLRAPLRTINGFARLLADREGPRLDGESRRLLSRIEAGAGRMGELIDDVIEYSAAIRRDPEFDEVDLDELVESVASRLAQAYPATRVELGPLGTLYGDARMIERIFEALIGNALKFSSRAASPHVRVWADERDGMRTLNVADNGNGFDMAHSSHLFTLFRRLHHDHEFPGTGVGLALVKNLVERHNGQVRAYSVPGQGATFSFHFGLTPD